MARCLRDCSGGQRERKKSLQPDLAECPDSAINGNWILSDFSNKEKGEKVKEFVISEVINFLTGEEESRNAKSGGGQTSTYFSLFASLLFRQGSLSG